MWIVGDHHDRLVEILVQALQNLQYLSGRRAFQIADWFIGLQ
jgi:hypothetical protein